MAFINVIQRADTGKFQLDGYHPYIPGKRIRKAAKGSTAAARKEEAAFLEKTILDAWHHGERHGPHSFAEIVEAYLNFQPRKPALGRLLKRLMATMGDIPAAAIDQAMIDALPRKLPVFRRPLVNPSSIRSQVVMPITTVLNFGAQRGWCNRPFFKSPKTEPKEPVIALPDEAERLIAACQGEFKNLVTVLFCTGMRSGEARSLDWRQVYLNEPGMPPYLVLQPWQTKAKKRRLVRLCPRAVAALAALAGDHTDGPVFLNAAGRRHIETGIADLWRRAVARAGLDPRLHPHSARHSWATWWYALWPNALALKEEGGWSTLSLVEVYAHLLAPGQRPAAAAFWGLAQVPDAHSAPGEVAKLDTIRSRSPEQIPLSA